MILVRDFNAIPLINNMTNTLKVGKDLEELPIPTEPNRHL